MRLSYIAAALSLLVIGIPAASLHAQAATRPAHPPSSLVVPIKTSTGEDAGTATFKESRYGKQLTIVLSLKNLPAGDHAVHIHQKPVCEAPNGTMNPMGHHAGDLPSNITIGADHTGTITFKVDYLTLALGAPNSVLGTSIMIHEKADDMMTDPTGNAGARIACGVIPVPGQ